MSGSGGYMMDVPEGKELAVYANSFNVSHSAVDFYLDFGMSVPGKDRPTVVARVVMTRPVFVGVLTAMKIQLEKFDEGQSPQEFGQGRG